MTETPSPLSPLTFEQLVELAEGSFAAARAPDKVAGWSRLLEVLRPLSGSGAAADDLVTGRVWSLIRVRAAGYQGVGPPIDLTLPPTPGITVLHGANGSGKSSIADAIETALHGGPLPAVVSGTGGKAALWERRHCGRDSERAHVQVTLTSGSETLVLTCRINSDGSVAAQTATLDTGTGPLEITVSRSGWTSALTGHRPVFGYAALERRLQRADDLQRFLAPMLAFGGCLDTLARRIAEASTPANEAAERIRAARSTAETAVDGVDQRHRRPDSPDLPDVIWPALHDDREAWLKRNGLTAEGDAPPEVSAGITERTRGAAENAVGALDDLKAAAKSVRARVAAPLRGLHDAAKDLDDPGDSCPVCGGVAAGWVVDLGTQLAEVTGVDELDKVTREAIRTLYELVRADVAIVGDALDRELCDAGTADAAGPIVAAAMAFADRVDADGWHTVPATRAALREVYTALRSEAWAVVVAEAAERSDHHARWRLARREAIAPLLDAWADLPSTAEADIWDSATRCLADLQGKIRTRRADELRDLAGTTVRDFLRDADLAIADISVQKTKATVGVVDGAGKPVELAMLSAGQRNALLLAPLLAVARGGPFGFLVLDDPVHALDEIRIDQLARTLETIATSRRVVVLTHDERLVEHLQARSVDCESRTVRRDPATGVVRDEPRASRWSVLVSDARAVLATASSHKGGVTLPPDDLVRSLCRMGFDAGLRAMIVNAAAAADKDAQPDLDRLDAVDSTKKRIAEARTLHPASAALVVAEGHVQPYLDDWNKAAHGNVASSSPTTAEIDAVAEACQALEGGP